MPGQATRAAAALLFPGLQLRCVSSHLLPDVLTNRPWPLCPGGRLVTRCLLLLVLLACSRSDPRFASPAATFRTHQRALASRNLELLWECYGRGYRESLPEGREGWLRSWASKSESQWGSEMRREISQERMINDRIGYLLFDANTLTSRQEPPFFYFVREEQGWKITTHLDPVFQHELEQAIERGEFKLPAI